MFGVDFPFFDIFIYYILLNDPMVEKYNSLHYLCMSLHHMDTIQTNTLHFLYESGVNKLRLRSPLWALALSQCLVSSPSLLDSCFGSLAIFRVFIESCTH